MKDQMQFIFVLFLITNDPVDPSQKQDCYLSLVAFADTKFQQELTELENSNV